MTVAVAPHTTVPYRALFPTWEGRRPVAWFFAEQLLEARAESDFPTNSAGCDEDVNMYLVGLLSAWTTSDPRTGVEPGATPLWQPPADPAAGQGAEYYRRQADHRLLCLGLFDRGDLVRRRRRGWRLTEAETRARDLAVAERSYTLAASLGRHAGLNDVWRKLARHTPLYVHVLQTLSRRHLGLGASLTDTTLARLLQTGAP